MSRWTIVVVLLITYFLGRNGGRVSAITIIANVIEGRSSPKFVLLLDTFPPFSRQSWPFLLPAGLTYIKCFEIYHLSSHHLSSIAR